MTKLFEQRIKEILVRIEERIPDLEGSGRSEAEAKIAYLHQVKLEEEQNNKLEEPKVFLSFVESGRKILDRLINRINHTKVPGTNLNFYAQTGMRIDSKGTHDVRQYIVDQMRPCCIFVGVLTKTYELTGTDGSFAPGAWALVEAGMALSLELPVIFFYQEGIHIDFWKKFMGDKRHVPFQDLDSYEAGLSNLTKRVQGVYRQLRKERQRK